MFPVQTPLGTQLLFGCTTANFEPLPKGQPHYIDVNHCAFYNFDPKVTRRLVSMQRLIVSEAYPSIMAKSWLWGSQITVKTYQDNYQQKEKEGMREIVQIAFSADFSYMFSIKMFLTKYHII